MVSSTAPAPEVMSMGQHMCSEMAIGHQTTLPAGLSTCPTTAGLDTTPVGLRRSSIGAAGPAGGSLTPESSCDREYGTAGAGNLPFAKSLSIHTKVHYDSREKDHRPSAILEERNNTLGRRAWVVESQSGYHFPPHTSPPVDTKSGPEFLKTWTSHNQRFGWAHQYDADSWHARKPGDREAELERLSTIAGTMYGTSRTSSTGDLKKHFVNPAHGDLTTSKPQMYKTNDARLAPGRFPLGSTWKLNPYGANRLPVRYPGGISSWLPSHPEIRWSAQKMDLRREIPRVKSEHAKAATAKATATVAALRAAGDSYFADREKDLAEKQALAKSSAGPAQTGKTDYAKYLQGMADRATEVANMYSGMAVQQMRDAKRLLKRARRSAEMASKRLVPRPERLMASAHQTLAAANAKKRKAEKYYEVAEAVTNANPAWQQAADEEA
eukprot:g10353.t1